MNNVFMVSKNKLFMDGGEAPDDDPRMQIYRPRLVELLDEEAAKDVSNAQVAREIGVSPEALSRWKKRGSVPQDPWQFMLLCRRLKTHPNYLLGWTDGRYPPDDSGRARELDAWLTKRKRELKSARKTSY